MLAIQAHCHKGNIKLVQEGIPDDSDVIVLFLNKQASNATSEAVSNAIASLNSEQRSALIMQSQTGFALTVLLDPAENCWDNI